MNPARRTLVAALAAATLARLAYNFTGGAMAGARGTISLARVGPVPPGCAG